MEGLLCWGGVEEEVFDHKMSNIRDARVESALQASCATALLGLVGDGQIVGLLIYQVFKASRLQIDFVLIQKPL